MKPTVDSRAEDLPLISARDDDVDAMEYDEDGSLALARALTRSLTAPPAADGARKPRKVGTLAGSWFLQLTQREGQAPVAIRGPMRIEVSPTLLRISGDIYVRQLAAGAGAGFVPIPPGAVRFGKNWYPQFASAEYSWYFRSLGVVYAAGTLVFKFERNLWNRTIQEFINQENSGKDTGVLELECFEDSILEHGDLPQPTLRLSGTARVGGTVYDAVATKTSPLHRGCVVEVDALNQREFPLSATTVTGAVVSFESIYRNAGMDCRLTIDRSDLPDDLSLTTIELQTALATHRRAAANADAWRLWLLVGSRQGSLYGLMFDDEQPFREGTAGFFDSTIPDNAVIAPEARQKKIGEVPGAFLRTLVHETGHAFNLFHPKSDVHNVAIGTTIMNQTGDVMLFATEQKQYPGNITFEFDDHNRTSLIHSPDPQVAPGWKRFGWGHGSLANGIAEPIDAAGLLRNTTATGGLTLEMRVQDHIYRGEFVTAQFIVTNTGQETRTLTSAINLSQGDLRLLLRPPNEELQDVRDVIVACGDRTFEVLPPGESLTGSSQIFYTNVGFTFRQTGRYLVSAELDVGDGSGQVLRSAPMPVVVRSPANAAEEEISRLSLTPGVGRAFAFGDYGADLETKKKLEVLASKYRDSDSGIAAALTLANAGGRAVRDVYTGRELREADVDAGQGHFSRMAEGGMRDDPNKLAKFAAAVAAPTDADAPVLEMTERHLDSAGARERARPPADMLAGDGAPMAGLAEDGAPPSKSPSAQQALESFRKMRRTLARTRK